MGSELLIQGDIQNFLSWAIYVGKVIENKKINLVTLEGVFKYYSLIPIASADDQLNFKKDVVVITDFINNLSPEASGQDIRLSNEFERILSLSKTYKLMAQNWISVNLMHVIEDFLLLRRGRFPKIELEQNAPDIIVLEKQGIYQTVLAEMIDLIERKLPKHENGTIYISFQTNIHTSDLKIIFRFEQQNSYGDVILEAINNNLLWKYLCREMLIYNVSIDQSGIQIQSKTLSPDNTFASRALEAYKMQNLLSKVENQISSQLLHDLKNHLIAYQLSLDLAGRDRTSLLKAKFEASQHLDNAMFICHSLEIVSNSMTVPTIEPVDVGEFVRSFIAEKLTVLPLNIRMEMPKTTGSSMVYTSKSFLKSIFENLIKNAVEAMPDGGEIRIDWLYDGSDDLVMIDISDTGPGLPSETISKIKTGKIVDSSKHKGSGIGILSVQSMVERLGGSCSVSSEVNKGTQWSITLPSMAPKELVCPSDTSESLDDTTDNEEELQ